MTSSRGREYAEAAASANVSATDQQRLISTYQNTRSSAGSAALVSREATGRRKMMAPGSTPAASTKPAARSAWFIRASC